MLAGEGRYPGARPAIAPQCSTVARPTPLTQNMGPQVRKRSRVVSGAPFDALACRRRLQPGYGLPLPGRLLPADCPAAAHGEQGLLMETDLTFMDCPAYVDKRGTVRCGLPGEVECRYAVRSTDGPVESARIRCPRGHGFNGPVESLTWDKRQGAAIPQAAGTHGHGTASLPARKTQTT